MTNIILLKDQAKDLGQILMDNFDEHRNNPLFTLWGCSFYWNSSGFLDQARSTYKTFIPSLFELAQEREMNATLRTIPRRSGIAFQYNAHCLSNRDLVERLMLELINDNELSDKVQEIISDKRLIVEAASTYVSLHEQGTFAEDIDFISFLLRYNPKDEFINMESNEFGGIYIPLAERLLYRFEKKAEDSIFAIDHPKVKEAEELHQKAVYGRQYLDPELQKMYDEAKRNEPSNSSSEVPDDSDIKVTKLYFPGFRRVRIKSNTSNLDWEKFFDYRNKELKIASSLNPTEIYINMTRELMIRGHHDQFTQNPVDTLICLQDKLGTCEGIQKRVLEDVYETFKGAYELMESPNLNHTLRLNFR